MRGQPDTLLNDEEKEQAHVAQLFCSAKIVTSTLTFFFSHGRERAEPRAKFCENDTDSVSPTAIPALYSTATATPLECFGDASRAEVQRWDFDGRRRIFHVQPVSAKTEAKVNAAPSTIPHRATRRDTCLDLFALVHSSASSQRYPARGHQQAAPETHKEQSIQQR